MISVACFGLYGAATSKWDMSVKVEESGAFEAFWDTLSFSVNGIVFFYSGAACINFFVRCAACLCGVPNPNRVPMPGRAAVLARSLRPQGSCGAHVGSPARNVPGLALLASLPRCWLSRLGVQAVRDRESLAGQGWVRKRCMNRRQMWRRMPTPAETVVRLPRARRSSQQLQAEGQLGLFLSTLWRFPLVYVFMFLIRFLLMAVFRPLFKITRQDLSFKEIAFACVAGLRGSVSLIMAQARARPARAAAGVAMCVVRLLKEPMQL